LLAFLLLEGDLDVHFLLHANFYAAHVGLMQDFRRGNFQHYRVAHLIGFSRSFLGGFGHHNRASRDTVAIGYSNCFAAQQTVRLSAITSSNTVLTPALSRSVKGAPLSSMGALCFLLKSTMALMQAIAGICYLARR